MINKERFLQEIDSIGKLEHSEYCHDCHFFKRLRTYQILEVRLFHIT